MKLLQVLGIGELSRTRQSLYRRRVISHVHKCVDHLLYTLKAHCSNPEILAAVRAAAAPPPARRATLPPADRCIETPTISHGDGVSYVS